MTDVQLKKLGLLYHSKTMFPDVKMYTVMALGFEIGLSKHSTIHDVYRFISSISQSKGFAEGINYERAKKQEVV